MVLLLGLLLPTVWCGANSANSNDGFSHILIKEGNTHEAPRGSSIQANINGHTLTVNFTESIGQVTLAITTASGSPVDGDTTLTPASTMFYIANTGDYIITFTLPNGDEYYGEFSITD